MSGLNAISVDKLHRLIGTPGGPLLIDIRSDREFIADPRLIPGSIRRPASDPATWTLQHREVRSVVIVCEDGSASPGTAAWLRQTGLPAETLENGFSGWRKAPLPLIPTDKLPPRDSTGRTRWVTRARPKVDRIACPWLIRRFVDPYAVFLFVNPNEVAETANRLGAAPFDVDGVHWSHRGDRCTFDAMVSDWSLTTDALLRLAMIVRGADTGRLDLAPESAGLLAASLGLSRTYADDTTQLEAGMLFYDALYRWCRDATDEQHVSHSTRKPRA